MDVWYFPRSELAQKYLKIFEVGISSNLAVLAPRRKGKTLFVLNDISKVAKNKKYIPVYASLWQNTNSPHEAIIFALKESIDVIDKNKSFAQLLKLKVKKTTLGNELIGKVELEFADRPQEPTSKDLLLLDQLLTKLQTKAKNKTILLMVDEAQHLATSSQFKPLTHALRTMLDKRVGTVKALFTGSSRHYMDLLFNDSQSPFYHFVETVPFPDLDDSFIQFLSENLKKRHKITVNNRDLKLTFESIDYSPYWMMKIISHMITFEASLKSSLNYVLQLIETAERFDQIEKRLKPIDKIVFLALSQGKTPFSRSLFTKIDNETSVKGVASNVQRSLKRLMDQQLVSQVEKGEYRVEKPGLKRYLTQREK